jgi:hypothetical protein
VLLVVVERAHSPAPIQIAVTGQVLERRQHARPAAHDRGGAAHACGKHPQCAGRADAVLHPFDRDGRQHMEYLREHASYADVPVDILMPAIAQAYPRLVAFSKASRCDFAKEAEEQGIKGGSSR